MYKIFIQFLENSNEAKIDINKFRNATNNKKNNANSLTKEKNKIYLKLP